MSDTTDQIRLALLCAFRGAADPAKAPAQQAYMKSEMPFLGVTVPLMRKLSKAVFKDNPLGNPEQWQANIETIWRGAIYREERYAAIQLLLENRYRAWITPSRVPLLRELIVTGAWWDYVDGIAAHAVGHLLASNPKTTSPMLRQWASESDIWIRRSAILAQLRRKAATDMVLLADCIEPSIGESEFFLRKAIGWALREYSKTNAAAVAEYVEDNADRLSALSQREALKVINKAQRKTF